VAHEINQMVFAGDVPWHGLGTLLPRNGTWEEIRDAAAVSFRNLATNFEKFGQLANYLAGVRFNEAQHRKVIEQVIAIPDDDKDHRRLEAQRETVGRLFHTFTGGAQLRGTAWGAVQAWTEWADHHRLTDGRYNPARAFEASILGSAARLKSEALAGILEELQAPSSAALAA